jgi:hypothetical protein
MQTAKLFHPLTGPELREIIISELKAKLDGSTLLQPHLTFPKAVFKLELTIESYPMNAPEEFVVERVLEVEGVPVKEALTEKIVTSKEVGETQETAPDALRIRHDMPVPQTIQDPVTGLHTDSPIANDNKVTVGAGTRPRGRANSVTVGKGAKPRGGLSNDVENDRFVPFEEGNVKSNTSA